MSSLEPGSYFMQGNEACVEAALLAGCRFFAGYPITPSTEIAERMARRMPEVNGVFIQMEDEISSIAAIIGASLTNTKSMTATSGPGFSLMQENLGFAYMTEIPIVVVDVQRAGPSTGSPTVPAQGDVMQSRWGSHGDYETIVLAPNSVQEMFDLTIAAFNLSEEYRVPTILLADADIGHRRQRFEVSSKIEIVNRKEHLKPVWYNAYEYDESLVPRFPTFGKGHRVQITGLTHDTRGYPVTDDPEVQEELVRRLNEKIRKNRERICRAEIVNPDAEIFLVAYGSPSNSAMELLRSEEEIGLMRPITIWPFPERELREIAETARLLLVLEMNMGQLYWEIERVARQVDCERVEFFPKLGGQTHTPTEILERIQTYGV